MLLMSFVFSFNALNKFAKPKTNKTLGLETMSDIMYVTNAFIVGKCKQLQFSHTSL